MFIIILDYVIRGLKILVAMFTMLHEVVVRVCCMLYRSQTYNNPFP
jgi:hypothetical protein